jgi:hypothetical protein
MPFVEAAVLDEEGVALPANAIGRLGVRCDHDSMAIG